MDQYVQSLKICTESKQGKGRVLRNEKNLPTLFAIILPHLPTNHSPFRFCLFIPLSTIDVALDNKETHYALLSYPLEAASHLAARFPFNSKHLKPRNTTQTRCESSNLRWHIHRNPHECATHPPSLSFEQLQTTKGEMLYVRSPRWNRTT